MVKCEYLLVVRGGVEPPAFRFQEALLVRLGPSLAVEQARLRHPAGDRIFVNSIEDVPPCGLTISMRTRGQEFNHGHLAALEVGKGQ